MANLHAMVDVLAGHSFEHEIATAGDLGLFGLIDMNRSDMLCQWSTDQFPNSIAETALAHRLDDLAARVLAANTDGAPVSGRQEYLENLANQFV